MSKNEVGFFLPIRLIRHASGRGGAGGAFPGYLGAVLVCPKHGTSLIKIAMLKNYFASNFMLYMYAMLMC